MSLSVSVPPLDHPLTQSPSPRSSLSASPPLSPSPALPAAALSSSIASIPEAAPIDPPSPGLEVRLEQRKQMQAQYEKEQHEANNNASTVAHEYRVAHPEIVQKFNTAYQWQVHVFLPTAAPIADANSAMSMASAYGKEAQIHQLTSCFMKLGIEEEHVFWHAVTIHNAAHVCDTVSGFRDALDESQSHLAPQDRRLLVVLNMCDGLDSDGYPGISVIKALESHKLRYTGGNPAFYHWTTDKLDIKKRLIEANVSTSPYAVLHAHYSDTETATALEQMGCGYPMVLKPAVSYASAGITVVWSAEQAIKEAARLRKEFGSVYAEMFIQGREFTVLVTGDEFTGTEVYDAAERCFDDKLPWHKQLLTFDLYWAVGKGPDDKPDYFYRRAPDADQAYCKEVARAAYCAVYGSGYGRVDMRMDTRTGRLYVLEANANCGFSESSDSSMGSILQSCKRTLAEMVERCFEYAVKRFEYQATHPMAPAV